MIAVQMFRRALCALVLMSASSFAQTTAVAPADRYARDFDVAWTFVRDNYAYFDVKKTDWDRVRTTLAPRAAAARNNDEFIGTLELMIEQLYDHHAHLGVNTSTSLRLVPTGTDVWAAHREGRAYVTAVRADSSAASAGIRAGMEILSINAKPVQQVVAARRPSGLREPDVNADDWALRVELAGQQNSTVTVELRDGETNKRVDIVPGRRSSDAAPLSVKMLPNSIALVRIHNSLGESALVAAFDAALATVRQSNGLIIDLRDTPSGGTSAVARGMLGRLIADLKPYQRHELPAEERDYGVKRIWVEYVAPRGPFTYEKPVVVLVGQWTGSMGEGIAIGLDGMQRATIIGTPMAGLLGAMYSEKLPQTGIEVRVPVERLYHVNGSPREAFVPRTPESLAKSKDKLIVAARELLR